MSEPQVKEIEPAKYHTLVRVAWLYYQEELTQAEIGERMGLSRVTVNRLLREARQSGIVEIKIRSDLTSSYPLAKQLVDRYALKDVFVSQAAMEGSEGYSGLAKEAALVLEQRLAPGVTIGVGIGRTIAYLPDFIRPSQPIQCRFTTLTGGLDLKTASPSHSFDVIHRLASLTGGKSFYIPAPSFVSGVTTRDVLLNDPLIAQSLDVARNCDVAIFSVGSADYSALLYRSGLLAESDLADLRDRQAVGDVLGRFFDAKGCELDVDINRRIIGLTMDELRKIPIKILVAGGSIKRSAIRGLLISQGANVLVTDLNTAQWLASTS